MHVQSFKLSMLYQRFCRNANTRGHWLFYHMAHRHVNAGCVTMQGAKWAKYPQNRDNLSNNDQLKRIQAIGEQGIHDFRRSRRIQVLHSCFIYYRRNRLLHHGNQLSISKLHRFFSSENLKSREVHPGLKKVVSPYLVQGWHCNWSKWGFSRSSLQQNGSLWLLGHEIGYSCLWLNDNFNRNRDGRHRPNTR